MTLRLIKKEPIFSIAHHMMEYPTPASISYYWNFGFLSGMVLGIQLITGIVLAMHYTPHVDYAFLSVEHIMRDVNYGWVIRYVHANGASMFFIFVYSHILRGLYYGSYGAPRAPVWIVGMLIYLAMMATAFLGYVLPWGQMSFWGATVITNFFSAIPVVGNHIVIWLWGGFSVDNATLNRFFSLHYLLPFVITALAIAHVLVLHGPKSGNPLGLESRVDRIPFHPYSTIKDFFSLALTATALSYLVFFNPNLLGHSDNYIPANPMSTPAHIVPEWYYLPFYAILRAVPDKLGGVIAMFGAIIIVLVLPLFNTSKIRSSAFRPIHKKFYWMFVASCLLLGWVGGSPAEAPFIQIGAICSIYYFAYFIVLVPVIGSLENALLRLGFEDEVETVENIEETNAIIPNKAFLKSNLSSGRSIYGQ